MRFRASSWPLEESDAVVDISPLMDVVFLLLIFFMVTTTFIEDAGLDLELPTTRTTASRAKEGILVAIDRAGVVYLDGEGVSLRELEDWLRATLAESEDKTVVIEADRSVDHGTVVRVMDILKRSGATGLTIAAEPEEGMAQTRP